MSGRAAIYCRISDARDGDTAGVDRQEADCRKLAKRKGWNIVGVYTDNSVSAFSGKRRPQFVAMMNAVAAGEIDVIVCWAADRLYRRLSDLEDLVTSLGTAQVATVQSGQVDLSTADGRMTARILGSVAQHESEKKGERISRAYRQRAESGRYGGGGMRRFGYNIGCTELVPDEAEALRWAYEQIAAGVSLRSVMRAINDKGFRNANGNPYVQFTFRKMLLRPMNAGHAQYKGEIFENQSQAPRIVDPVLWAQVRAILTDPARQPHDGKPARTLLSGIARCGVCGGSVRASQATDKDAVYRCYDAAHVSRRRRLLDPFIHTLVVQYLSANGADIIEAMDVAGEATDASVEVAEASRIRKQINALPDLLAAGDLDAAAYASGMSKLRDRLTVVESAIAVKQQPQSTVQLLAQADIEASWTSMDVDAQRSVLKEIIDHIRIDRLPKTGRRSTLDGVTVVWR